MVGLLGDPRAWSRGLAQYFTGEQVGSESARTDVESDRAAMAGLLGAAQGIAASGALSPTYSPWGVSPVVAATSALAGGMQGASAAELYNFQAQQLALQRSQQAREQARRLQMRQLLGQVAVGSIQMPGGPPAAQPAAAPVFTGAPPAPGAAPGAAPALPATLSLDTVPQLPALANWAQPQRDIFGAAVTEAGLNPEQANRFARMVFRESGARHTGDDGQIRTSRAGARGIAQLLPSTFTEVAERHGLEGTVDDEATNMRAGARYFRQMLDQFGNLDDATAAYNAGPGRWERVRAGTAEVPTETRNYLAAVSGPAAPPQLEAPATALATAARVPRSAAETLLGLTPQDAMLLMMLDDEQLGKALTEILKARQQGGGAELLSVEEATRLGLPNAQTARYQRAGGGENRGRITEVGGGGTRITLEQSAGNRMQELDIAALGRARGAAEGGATLMPQLRLMQTALLTGGVDTGPITGARAALGNVLADANLLGRDQLAQLNNTKLFQALAATVVPQMRPIGAGSTSDRDLALFQQAAPGMANTPIGNLLILGSMVQVREAQAREADAMEAFMRANNGSLNGYSAHARQSPVQAFPRLTDDDAGTRLAASLPSGTVVLLPSGRLGVKLPDGSFDRGSGEELARYRRTQGAR